MGMGQGCRSKEEGILDMVILDMGELIGGWSLHSFEEIHVIISSSDISTHPS